MSGTKIGAKKTAKKNLERDPDFYKKIGAIGGKRGTTGGFYNNSELASRAGKIGGKISKRLPSRKPY